MVANVLVTMLQKRKEEQGQIIEKAFKKKIIYGLEDSPDCFFMP